MGNLESAPGRVRAGCGTPRSWVNASEQQSASHYRSVYRGLHEATHWSGSASRMTVQHPSTLTWQLFVAPPVPVHAAETPPGQTQRAWSPISATLISGEHDAVLV